MVVDPIIEEIVYKFVEAIVPDTEVAKVNFGQVESDFIKSAGADNQDLVAMIHYQSAVPEALCVLCPFNKGCPHYVSNEVCFYLTEPFKIRRNLAHALEDIRATMNIFMTSSSMFTENWAHRDSIFFIFFVRLYQKVAEFQIVGKARVPRFKRRKTKLTAAHSLVRAETRKDLHRRWSTLKIPNQEHRFYYPHS